MNSREFEKVFYENHIKLLFIARKYVDNDQEADDVVQHAFLKLWEYVIANKTPPSPEGFLTNCVKHKCLDVIRRIKRKRADDKVILYLSNEAQNQNIEYNVIRGEQLQQIHTKLKELPEKTECVIKLHLEGYSTREICTVTGLDEDTIRVHKKKFIDNFNNPARQKKVGGITYKGQTKSLSRFCKQLGLPYTLTYQRIVELGWSVEKAFEAPEKTGRKEYRSASDMAVSYNGESKHLSEWCEELKIMYKLAYKRIFLLKWSPEKAFNEDAGDNPLVIYKGEEKYLKDLCYELNMNYNVVYTRLFIMNWPIEKALSTSERKRHIVNYEGKDIHLSKLCKRLGVVYQTALVRLNAGKTLEEALDKAQDSPTVEHKGKQVSLRDLCNNMELDYDLVHTRIFQRKWSVEKALTTDKKMNRIVNYDGEDISLRKVCKKLGLKYTTIKYRMYDGKSFEEAIKFERTPKVEYMGNQITIADLCSQLKLNYDLVHDRIIARKWSVEKAITTPRHVTIDRIVNYQGQDIRLVDLCKQFGISRAALEYRLSIGMSVEEAVLKPTQKKKV